MSPPLTCAAAGCDEPVLRSPGRRGRPPIYCSPSCRPSRQPGGRALTVEVALEDADGQATGRDWVVQMRRDNHTVVVSRGLGRLSAAAFADELRWFLGLSRQKGAT